MKIKLNDYQTKVVNHEKGNVSVLASAGSGKTAVIVERIRRLVKSGVAPESILCISFSKKACDNLITRTKRIGDLDISTFHALALKIVQSVSDNKYTLWTTKWEKEQAICDIVKNLKYEWNVKKIPTTEIMTYINIQKMNMVKPGDTQIVVEEMPYTMERLQRIYAEYERYKARHDYIEFNDLVPMACDFFEVDDELVDEYRSKYDYIFVDEYQDISKDQHMLLKYINSGNLMVVGDKNQCQPAGTKISLSNGTEKNIEDIEVGDEVVYYNIRSAYISGLSGRNQTYKPIRVTKKACWDYSDGDLITITTESGIQTSYTPNHIAYIKLHKTEYEHVVYLMCNNENRFRIGKINFYNFNNSTHINSWRAKMYDEGCCKIWLLKVFKTDLEARVEEQRLSYKYQIPQICWQTNKVKWTQEDIDYIYRDIDTYKTAKECLKEFNKDINYPLLDTNDNAGLKHLALNAVCKVFAANIMPEVMDVLVYDKGKGSHRNKHYEQIVKVEHKYITEPIKVYSLETEGGTYIGDRIMTHNCIYSFRGANYHYITDFDKMWDNVTVYNLPTNYRCSKDIVEASNALVRNCEYPNYVEAIADKPDFAKPVIRKFIDQSEELQFMKDTIFDSVDSLKREFRDFAVLARTNAQLSAIQTAFSESGIPFEVVGGSNYYELPEIKIFVEYLKLVNNHNNNSAFAYIFNKPNRFLPNKLLDEMRSYSCMYDAIHDYARSKYARGLNEIKDIIEHIGRVKWDNVGEVIKYLRDELDIDSFVRRGIDADLETLSELKNNIDTFQRNCGKYKSIPKFLYAVEQFMRGQTENKDKNKVKLMTIHKSKGLEFPVVFVTGCSADLLPHKRTSDVEDERRLFYVAMTRAEDELYLLHTDNSNDSIYSPSPFLNDVWDYCEVFDYE